ncbi:MAG TPA: shikimate dehydrogenase [Candidatus Hydrogenedens sp.]|nr:shikimate dehydrogenase [Candidatus Hydrogenedens sp.]HOL18791.1 shikimate dehydrogenase [Candidatus Hydrogenedens sp.]HPP58380.1 shikimate dehydrogenase [Candidatus Hydrogenedens sp.]
MKIDVNTKLCAVIGHPVRHSLSPVIHNAGFQSLGLNYVYLAFDVTDLEGCLKGMRALDGFRGISVTIPHKEAVIQYLDRVDPVAQKIGSVNTITHEGEQLLGTNTDGQGTLKAFSRAGVTLSGKRILFLGAGGAVRAVAFTFAQMVQPAQITILGRTPSRLEKLLTDLKHTYPNILFQHGYLSEDIQRYITEHEIIIQGTPMGMEGHNSEKLAFPFDVLSSQHVVFDMVYRPLYTELIKEAQKRNCTVITGIEMLVEQAVLQFELWTGIPAPVDVMRNAVEKVLKQCDI